MHVIGPELGLTQPGMTIACGDSHTSTHGALGAIAFGIGTSQVRDVLASQCLALDPLKVRRIDVNGRLAPGVYAKDVILTIIRRLGVQGGVGFAYEYGGSTLDAMTIDERMTVCNMSIEGGARVGYVNPDETTFAFLRGPPVRAEPATAFDRAVAWWRQIASDADARYDDRVALRRGVNRADRDVGHQPGPVGRHQRIDCRRRRRRSARVHGIRRAARASTGTQIDVAFIGSCTNGRLSDLEEAARLVPRPPRRAARQGARRAGLAGGQPGRRSAGARRRSSRRPVSNGAAPAARCASAMNPDRLEGRQVCASSSNRNFKGRQGSPTGRTLLMSPAMVVAAAMAGEVVDVRELLEGGTGMSDPAQVQYQRSVSGRGLPLRGNDLDTDRIMPARFLRVGDVRRARAPLFEDDRAANPAHPFNDPRYDGATMLIVNSNFGCGSSREHAPQGLARCGHSGRSSANRSRKSFRATRRCSVSPASSRTTTPSTSCRRWWSARRT